MIYDLPDRFKILKEMGEDEENPLDPDVLQDTMLALEGELHQNVGYAVRLIRNIDLEKKAIDSEIERLRCRSESKKKKMEAVKQSVIALMQGCNETKVADDLFTVTVKNGRDVVCVTDESCIPDRYTRVKVETSPIKPELLKALKAGEEVPGAEIGKSKPSLVIK